MEMIRGLFTEYSNYSGSGVLLMFFFAGMLYLALLEQNRSTRTAFLHGSVCLTLVIFFPPLYDIYTRFVDAGTYWRLFWMLPVACGLAYVATGLIEKHKWTGLLLTLVILILGGELIYFGEGNGEKEWAENAYQLPQEVVDIVDQMERAESGGVIRAAFPPELLVYVRQYSSHILMPYGREMLDDRWHAGESGYYEVMSAETVDFEALSQKCLYNDTRYVVISSEKAHDNDPRENGFTLFYIRSPYIVYEYVGGSE